jgi:hypothetical protein
MRILAIPGLQPPFQKCWIGKVCKNVYPFGTCHQIMLIARRRILCGRKMRLRRGPEKQLIPTFV